MTTQKKYKMLFVLFGLLSSCCWFGCKETYDILPDQPVDSYNRVYMPQSVNGPVKKIITISDNPQTLIYGANFGGQDYPDKNISVTFTVNQALADAYNTANKTNYPILPSGSYALSGTNAVIPKGKLSTEPLRISLKTKGDGAMDALKTYILPVKMSTSDAKVNEALSITYYLVTAQPDLKDYPDFDRSAWKIIGFSSEEATGEGANNGRAVFAIDGNTSTYWHSKWQNGQAAPPHFLTIDMGGVKALHGLGFIARQSDASGKPNEVNVQTSVDNTEWVDAGTFNLENNQNLQKKFLPEGFNKNARYVKVTINSSFNSTVTHLAELYAF